MKVIACVSALAAVLAAASMLPDPYQVCVISFIGAIPLIIILRSFSRSTKKEIRYVK
jgi:hypothetical protein